MNEHLHADRLCPGCAAEVVKWRELAADLAAEVERLRRPFGVGVAYPDPNDVMARYREARQR